MGKKGKMKRRAMIFLVAMMLVLGTFSAVVHGAEAPAVATEDHEGSTPVIASNGREVKHKTFYMYHLRDAVGVGGRTTKEVYNTTYPVGPGNRTDESSFRVLVDWYLYPPLAGDLRLDGTSTLTVWANRTSGPSGGVTITYELREVDKDGNEVFIGENEEAKNIGTSWGTHEVTLEIDNHTVSEGSTLKITLDIWGSAANKYEIAYGGVVDGGMRDTNVTLPCRNYIKVSDVYTTNHEGNVTNLFNPEALNKTIYIHANITNPFGGYDIHWVNVTLKAPDGSTSLNMSSMEKVYGHFNEFESGYIIQWNYSDEPEGTYNVTVRAVDNTGHRIWSETGDFGGHDEYGYHKFVVGGLDHYVNLRIFDDMDYVLPDVMVRLKVSETEVFATNITDAEGITNFTVAKVMYTITIIWQDVEVNTNRTLDVGEVGNRTRDEPYDLTAGVFYPSFEVQDMEGEAVDGANVYMGHPNGTTKVEPFVTDHQGRFGLEQTAEGIYILQVEWKGRDVGTFEVTVSSSDVHTFNVYVYHLLISVQDDSGMPVSNALVVASYNDTMIVAESRLTNQDGEVDTRLPAAEYLLQVYWNDAKVYEDSYVLSSSGTLVITAGIYGVVVTVYDTLDHPLEGADVTATYTSTGREVDTGTTDENGMVIFQLANGEHRFDVTWLEVEVARQINIVSQTQREFDIIASVYQLNIITLDGTVDGNVLAEARISIWISGNLVDTSVTDATGSYISRLPGTQIDLEVRWKGIVVYELNGYDVNENHELQLLCDVYYLDITVLDSRGAVVEGVNLRIKYHGEVMATATSDENGVVRTRLPVEVYTIKASWYGVEVAEVEHEMIPAQGENELLLACDIYYLTVTVVDAENAPLPDTSADFYLRGNLLFTGSTDTYGVLTTRLPKEIFEITFAWRGFTVANASVYMDGDQDLTVEASVYHVNFEPVDSQGEAVSGAEVQILYNGEVFERGRITDDGFFSIRSPHGEFTMIVVWQGVTVYREIHEISESGHIELACNVYYLTVSGIDSRGDEVQGIVVTVYHTSLPEGQDLLTTVSLDETPTIRLPGGTVRLHGEWRGFFIADDEVELSADLDFELECDIYYLDVTVVDSEGVPLDGADLVLKDASGTAFVTEVTDTGASTPRLPKGRWTLEAYWRGHKVGTLETEITDEDTEIILEAAVHYLRVTVEGRKGPIEGVELTLLDAEGTPLLSIETGEDGKAEFTQIVQGDYTLIGRLKTTQLMTDIDMEESVEVGLYSSEDILLNFEGYPRPVYKTNLFYAAVLIAAILAVGILAIARKKEVL